MKRIVNAIGELERGKELYAVFLLCTITIALPAQTFTTLHSFNGADGAQPSTMVQAADGNLYGTTFSGGANPGPYGDGTGTVFKISPSGALTTIYSFCSQGGNSCTDGYFPLGGLVQALDGDFYGTTYGGGAPNDFCYGGCGTVFKLTASGILTTLYNFCSQSKCTDGANPGSTLVRGIDGDFYGTTEDWGVNGALGDHSAGTVFKITPSGTLTTLYSFCVQRQLSCSDGSVPEGLIQANDGDFYGTTIYGGANSGPYGDFAGTVFKVTPRGTLTIIYSFCSQSECTDGAYPDGLVQTTHGELYGTAALDGAEAGGSVFQLTPGGILTTLYSFCSSNSLYRCADGDYPAGLVQATDGDLYGITSQGGANFYYGTVFKLNPRGGRTTLHNFCSAGGLACTDGAFPSGALVQATNGDVYGTTGNGGAGSCASGCGTIFVMSLGLAPFVETRPPAAKVGAVVKILGTHLTGASRVTFNGTPAVFAVSSSPAIVTEITTYVPAGAISGTVQVVTPGGTLSSNLPFRVVP